MDLQNQLKELENKIAYARQFYNDVVLKLNTAIETVPTNIIAGLFHFEQAQYFEADDASRQVPQVQFCPASGPSGKPPAGPVLS